MYSSTPHFTNEHFGYSKKYITLRLRVKYDSTTIQHIDSRHILRNSHTTQGQRNPWIRLHDNNKQIQRKSKLRQINTQKARFISNIQRTSS
ncbi:hypothetical protein XF_0364 [Xylella fastidiosa 9a5c]|uniref:Uncharacterized protein n=1 Tax=Xylella fastidiosa (strain 9a5c) TaxID=160492 RepID=Q9PGD8_XYLFA|nr:hypothetical protein XF_0364 [Xylella fastidiosa 9a5c]